MILIRRFGLCTFLIIFQLGVGVSVSAQTYSCRTDDKTQFFTDDPALLPSDCGKVSRERTIGADSLSITKFEARSSTPVQDQLAGIKTRREQLSQTLEDWKKAAQQLVSQYEETRKQLNRPIRVASKIQLRKELLDIKARRDALLAEIHAARLPFRDRGTVAEILAVIPDD